MTSTAAFDVFLSYNHADAQTVREIRERLAARGVRSFLDDHDLNVGKAWPAEVERALRNSRAVAVFIGKSGYGRWQQQEIDYAMNMAVQSNGDLSVIPVILEGANPPEGFLARYKGIDLRGGIDDASIERLARAARMAKGVATPPSDISPYRRLEAFREEDAPLFFGRQAAVDSVVSRIDEASGWEDRPRLVTVAGPSGSGKSSVVHAGVLPRLRSRRPPRLVWEAVVMQPRGSPWRSLASALVPLLEPTMSEVDRIGVSGTLADNLRSPGGIVTATERILEKSRGTDRLLIVVDQFEELLTPNGEGVAREFVHALLDASRNAPLCVLATLRSDYYGKAIALDRDLSDALPGGQVNLGPMRRDELRDAVVRPASLAGLTFDAALVDRILDDVGNEPGTLPLLEYALSELWDLRVDGRLTFVGYQKIGGVSGALTRRAEAIHGELSNTQKEAARKLLLRLVRVSAADEEGADTRHRVRRQDISDEDWKLVQAFAGERARLVVTSKDPTSGEEGVEVAHEALIRQWGRLREWINDDREFLLWRQNLAIYRAVSPAGMPPGPLVTKASEWLRERGDDLSDADRAYIEKSVAAVARTRTVKNSLIAAAVIVMFGVGGWIPYTTTAFHNVQTILAKNPEAHFPTFETADGPEYEANVARMITLLRLGRYDHIRRQIAAQDAPGERAKLLAKLALAMHAVSPDRAGPILKEAIAAAKQAPWPPRWQSPLVAQVARAAARLGDNRTAIELLQSPEATPVPETWSLREVAKAWTSAGRPENARQVLRAVFDFPATGDQLDQLDRAAEELVRLGETDVARKLPKYVGDDVQLHTFYGLAHVRAHAAAGDVDEAQEIVAQLPKTYRPMAWGIIAKLDFPRHRDPSRTRAVFRAEGFGEEADLLDYVIGELVRQRRDREVERLIAEGPYKYSGGYVTTRVFFVQHLIDAGRVDDAARAAEPLKAEKGSENRRSLAFVRLGAAYARAGRQTEAEDAFRYAESLLPALLNEYERDQVNAVRAPAEASLGRFREARRIADGIESDTHQWEAYFGILEVYAKQEKNR